jgi:hypothetical protein
MKRNGFLSSRIDKVFDDLTAEKRQDGYGAKGQLCYEINAADFSNFKNVIVLKTDDLHQALR